MELRKTTYLDNLTKRPILIEAKRAMDETISMGLGDPRSTNLTGRECSDLMEDLSHGTAELFGAESSIFFGSESLANGSILLAAGRRALEDGRPGILYSPFESSATIEALRILQSEGSRPLMLDTGIDGRILTDSVSEKLDGSIGLIACSWADGSAGILQPVDELASLAETSGVWFHSDASHAAGRVSIDLSSAAVDSIVVSSPKMGGPPGCAAALLRNRTTLEHLPEFTIGSSTFAASGMMAAMQSLTARIAAGARIENRLRDDLFSGLDSMGLKYSIIGGSTRNLLPGTAMLELSEEKQRLHAMIEKENIILPSHNSTARLSYLRRMDLEMETPDRYVGFSIDHRNSSLDIEHFLKTLGRICN